MVGCASCVGPSFVHIYLYVYVWFGSVDYKCSLQYIDYRTRLARFASRG